MRDLHKTTFRSKLSVLLLLMACVVCSKSTAQLNSKSCVDTSCVKVFGKALKSSEISSDGLNYLVAATFKIKLVNINEKSLSYDLIYFEQLNNTLKPRGPPLA